MVMKKTAKHFTVHFRAQRLLVRTSRPRPRAVAWRTGIGLAAEMIFEATSHHRPKLAVRLWGEVLEPHAAAGFWSCGAEFIAGWVAQQENLVAAR